MLEDLERWAARDTRSAADRLAADLIGPVKGHSYERLRVTGGDPPADFTNEDGW